MNGDLSHQLHEPLDEQIGELAGHVHSATARLADMAAELDSSGEWSGIGMRSCAHWLSIATGVDLWVAGELVRVGHALAELPLIHQAFAGGRLSFDKVRVLTQVVTAVDESLWLELALEASGAQLALICREFRRAVAVEDPERVARQRARRRLTSWWLDADGMLSLYALLPPEEGRLVLNAIESAVVRPVAASKAATVAAGSGDDAGGVDGSGTEDDRAGADDPCVEATPDSIHGALRADALVRVCEGWLDGSAGTAVAGATAAGTATGAARAELVVHVDLETLTGAEPEGRCHLQGGPALSVAVARRIGCDARVVAVIEKDGVPVHGGRARRMVSPRMRRILQLRDEGCRYPGCTVPARDTEEHHVDHWACGGPTEVPNLVSLCRFHHHRHHEGLFQVVAMPRVAVTPGVDQNGTPPDVAPTRSLRLRSATSGGTRRDSDVDFQFLTIDGRRIGASMLGRGAPGESKNDPRGAEWLRDADDAAGRQITATTPAAADHGRAFDIDHAIQVIANNVAYLARRKREQGAGP